jgi:Holliday junction DNA helicase RuvA
VISKLDGKAVEEEEDRLVVDVGGVGYEVIVPPFQMKALRSRLLPPEDPRARLTDSGIRVTLHIYHHVPERKPVPVLFGFNDPKERRFFELLAGVSRFGPMAAAKSMVVSVPEYASRIMTRDTRGLTQLPGIGAGKAEQIIAQLRSKVALFAMMPDEKLPERPVAEADDLSLRAQIALEDLGHKPAEAEAMVRAAREARPKAESVEELLEAVWSLNRAR